MGRDCRYVLGQVKKRRYYLKRNLLSRIELLNKLRFRGYFFKGKSGLFYVKKFWSGKKQRKGFYFGKRKDKVVEEDIKLFEFASWAEVYEWAEKYACNKVFFKLKQSGFRKGYIYKRGKNYNQKNKRGKNYNQKNKRGKNYNQEYLNGRFYNYIREKNLKRGNFYKYRDRWSLKRTKYSIKGRFSYRSKISKKRRARR